MAHEKMVLCASSKYEQKFYLNEEFEALPEDVKKELKVMCVLFTEDIGGILTLEFDEEGYLHIQASYDEGDLLYDDIGGALKIRQMEREHEELLQSVELYYRAFFLDQDISDMLDHKDED